MAFHWGDSAVLKYKEVPSNCCYVQSIFNKRRGAYAQLVLDCRDLVRLPEFTTYCGLFLVLGVMGWDFCY